MRRIIGLTLFTVVIVAASPSWAYYTVQDTGDLLKPNQMRFGAELEFVTHGDTGIDVNGRFDHGLTDDLNLRVELGSGTTELLAGAYLKWVPFPDYDKQPAIGLTAGAHYAHYKSANEVAFRLIPFASKTFATDYGPVTPYAGLPFAFATYDGNSFTPVQLALGVKYHFEQIKQCDFTAELDFDINQAPNSITFGAVFPAFD
jgi:hypothetical protein